MLDSSDTSPEAFLLRPVELTSAKLPEHFPRLRMAQSDENRIDLSHPASHFVSNVSINITQLQNPRSEDLMQLQQRRPASIEILFAVSAYDSQDGEFPCQRLSNTQRHASSNSPGAAHILVDTLSPFIGLNSGSRTMVIKDRERT